VKLGGENVNTSTRKLIVWLLYSLMIPAMGCATVLQATRDNDYATLRRLLQESSQAGEKVDDELATALNVAAAQGNVTIVRMLLNARALHAPAARNGAKALDTAISKGRDDVVRLLAEAGVNLNTPRWWEGRGVTPFQLAAFLKRYDLAEYLLSKGANGFALTEGQDYLTLVAGLGVEEYHGFTDRFLRFLKNQYGDETTRNFLDMRRPNGWTPLTAAAHHGDSTLVKLLLAHGASTSAMADSGLGEPACAGDAWPPIFFALMANRQEVAQQLQQAGADSLQTSQQGQSLAQAYARRQKRVREAREMAELLRQAEEESQRRSDAMAAAVFEGLARGVAAGLEQAKAQREAQYELRDRVQRELEEARARREQQEMERSNVSSLTRTSPTQTREQDSRGPSAPYVGSSADAASNGRGEEEQARREQTQRAEQARQAELKAAEEAEEARKAKEKEAKRAEEERKAEERRQAKAEQARQFEEQRKAKEAAEGVYLNQLRQAFQFHVTTCPGGEGYYYLLAKRPSITPVLVTYIDVYYRASCPGGTNYAEGMIRNFMNSGSCFNGPTQISSKLPCKVEEVSVRATDVQISK